MKSKGGSRGRQCLRTKRVPRCAPKQRSCKGQFLRMATREPLYSPHHLPSSPIYVWPSSLSSICDAFSSGSYPHHSFDLLSRYRSCRPLAPRHVLLQRQSAHPTKIPPISSLLQGNQGKSDDPNSSAAHNPMFNLPFKEWWCTRFPLISPANFSLTYPPVHAVNGVSSLALTAKLYH
jgi:hypothetical protein